MKQLLIKFFAVNFILLLSLNGQSQNQRLIDSLNTKLKTTTNDSIKVELLFRIGYYTLNIDSQLEFYAKANMLSQKINGINIMDRGYDSSQVRIQLTTVDSDKIKLLYNLASLSPNNDTIRLSKAMNAGIALAVKNKLVHLQAEGLIKFGNEFVFRGPSFSARAIALFDSALRVAMRAGDKEKMAESYHYLGATYSVKGDYARALDYYNKGNMVANEAKDSMQMMLNYHDLGRMRISMKDYVGSYVYLNKALELAITTKNSFWIGDNALHLGEAYWNAKQFDSSLIYSNRALQLFTATNNTGALIGALNQIGWVHESKAEWKEAEEVYRSALKLSQDSDKAAPSFSGLGDALYGQGRYKEALPNYLKAEKCLKGFGWAPNFARELYEGLANTYAKLGDYKNAYDAYIEFKSASDSVLILENTEKLTATQSEHDFEKLKSETKATQEKKDVTQQTELAKQRSQKYIFIGGAVLLLLIAIGLISRLRFARKSRLLLEEKNKLIFEEKEIAQRMQLRAEQSEKFKQQFLANMSHEIRTPMNAVMGMTNLVLDTQLNPKQKKYMTGVKNASENLLHVINEILDLSKIEAGKIEMEEIDFSIRDVVEQVYQVLKHKADEKGIELITSVDANVPDVVVGDPARLTQVLINLAGNAIKFTEKGSVQLAIGNEQLAKENGSPEQLLIAYCQLHFSIIDTGIGIPKEKLESVFESFSQAHISDSRKYGGTGLGLTISKQFINLMGGELQVESVVNSGSTFSFTLNLPVASAENLLQKNLSEEIDGNIIDGLRILLVDDSADNRIVCRDTLESKSKVKIEEAVNGQEAVALLSEKDFDVVLMDVQMPVMDGYEATRQIRSLQSSVRNHDVPVIALTASVIKSDLDKCRAAGMNDYVPKPFKTSELITAIAKAAGREIVLKKQVETNKIHVTSSPDFSSKAIDLSYLEEFCEGDKERMKKYINIFLGSTPVMIEKLNTAMAENNFEEIASQLHAFKTKLVMMGMDEVKELALKIELECRTNTSDFDAIKNNVSGIIKSIENAVSELSELV